MATFRSVLSRWIFAAAVICGSFAFMGAAFAPLRPSFQGFLDPMRLGPPMESKIISGPKETRSSSRRDVALSRLGELILAHRAISVSA